MARRVTFQGKFEHAAPAIRKKWEIGQAPLVISIEESTPTLNEFEKVDLKKMFQVLGRTCDSIALWEATSDFHEVDAVLTPVVKLASNFHSFTELINDISQVKCGKEKNSEVTDKQGGLPSNDQLSFSSNG